MFEELTQAGAGGAAPAGAGGEGSGESVAQGTEGTPISAEVQKIVDAAVAGVREEYEGKGGHLSKLKSKMDTKIAELEKQLRARDEAQSQEAQQLIESGNHAQAAQILAAQNEELRGRQQSDQRRAETADWIGRIMGDLGYDLEGDEEAAALAAGWLEKLEQNPNLTYDFQQEVARARVEAEQQSADKAQKELDKMTESLPDLVKAQVVKTLADAGLAPEPTGEGGGSKKKEDDWRNKPASQLIREGIKAKRKAAIRRTSQE